MLCVQIHKEHDTFSILDLEQWEFYVLARAELIEESKMGSSITLTTVQKEHSPTPYAQLATEIRDKFRSWSHALNDDMPAEVSSSPHSE